MGLTSNYQYFFYYFNKYFEKDKAKSLDFGCGDGMLIEHARANGYDFHGVENYCEGLIIDSFNESAVKEYIKIITSSDKLPYPDDEFDFITSIQVFEHVEHLELSLNELKRVLKKDGKILCTFPYRISFMEGHIGIPFFHWFPPSKRNDLREKWTRFCCKIGFGYNRRKEVSFDDWYKDAMDIVDKYCFYRKKRQFKKVFSDIGFSFKRKDKEKILFQLKSANSLKRKIIYSVLKITPGNFISFVMQIKSSVCLELTKN